MATILIVDDDPIVREVAAEMLRSTNHAAIMAEDGQEALGVLQHVPIDVVVTDMLMPALDGVELIMTIRSTYPHIRLLAISGGGSFDAPYLLNMAKSLGADAILEKPLRVETFVAAVQALVKLAGGETSFATNDVSFVRAASIGETR